MPSTATARILLMMLLAPPLLVPTAGSHVLFRCYSADKQDHMTSEMTDCEGYQFEYPLGCTADAGTPLYRCRSPHDGEHMASLMSDCEGYAYEHQLGYLYPVMPPGGRAVYRCYYVKNDDHMLSNDPNCEAYGSAAKEAIMGYLAGYFDDGYCGGTDRDWPVFNSWTALQGDPWGTYFKGLYGELPSSFPLNLSDFWCFYIDKMAAANIKPPLSIGQCPTQQSVEGQRYDENNFYSSRDLTWLWHAPSSSQFPASGFDSNAIVEISHERDPFGDEHQGMWFVYAKGSGVYLDLGNTKVFNDHPDAYKFFGTAADNEKMCQAAAAAGYDSIQFIRHRDAVNYPCAARIGVDWMNIEIVAVKLSGTYACGQAQGTAPALRAGWNGDKPCKCDPSNPNTNCVFS